MIEAKNDNLWIPCYVRLPVKGTDVYVWFENSKEPTICTYLGDGIWDCNAVVIAWRPLNKENVHE